jgi:tRNA(adenine34) deaminase
MVNNTSQDIFFMEQALLLAKQAESVDEVPVGAIVVINNEVIGAGFNCSILTSDPTAHAEIVALRKAAQKMRNYRLPEATLYVTLEPCIMCIGAILHARIKRLVFGANDPKVGVIANVFKILEKKKLNYRIEFQEGVLAFECGKILADFFQNKR